MTPAPMVVHIPAGVAIDESVREEHVELGLANLRAENARVNALGALGKRPGYSQLTLNRMGTGVRSAGHRIAAHRGTIAVSDGDILDVYSPTVGEWIARGRLPGCDVKRKRVSSMGIGIFDMDHLVDVTYANGFYVAVLREISYRSASTTFVKLVSHVIDADTGMVVLVHAFSGTELDLLVTQDVKVVAAGTDVIAIWSQGGTIYGSRLSTTNVPAGFAASVSLATDSNGTGAGFTTKVDACGLTTSFVIAYENTSLGNIRITARSFSATVDALTPLASSVVQTLGTGVSSIAVCGSASEEIWFAWGHAANANVYVAAHAPSTLASIFTLTVALTLTGTTDAHYVALNRTAANEVYVAATALYSSIWKLSSTARVRNVASAAVVDRGFALLLGWFPLSKPFAVAGRVYMEFAYDDSTQSNVVLADITGEASSATLNKTLRPVGWAAPRSQVYTISGGSGNVTARHVAVRNSTIVGSVHIVKASPTAATLCITEYDFGSAMKHLPCSFADGLYLTGGVLYRYDGHRVYEDGFVVPPSVSVTANGVGLTGTFLYCAVYEYTDALGNVIISAPSAVQTIVLANQGTTVSSRVPVMTWKDGNDPNSEIEPKETRRVRVKIYRTPAGGGDFYLISTLAHTAGSTGSIVQWGDTLPDVNLIVGAKLYKAPGRSGTAKDRQATGAVRHAVECNGVLVVIGDDGSTLRAYAERVVGEAPWHHDNLQIPIDGDGDVMALSALDGAVVAFKRDAIYVVPVEPASANLSAGGFGFPRRIAVDAGCIDPRSVVLTGIGIFFQSDRGIELLTRSLSVEYVGEKIQKTFALYPNVTSAVLDVKNGLVRFSLAQTGSSTVGIDAVFDLTLLGWVSFDLKRGAAASAQSVSAAYAFHAGSWRYMWVESNGEVHYENAATWLDKGSTWATLAWEPAWVKTELQREHQFWQADLLHERKSACGLTTRVAYDWAAADPADDKVWNEAAMLAYPRQVELRLTSRSQGVKCRFEDTAPAVAGTGQGLEFVGLSVDLASHQGATQGTPRLAVGSRR